MERAELRLAPGLNVVTGETGAGKTLLAHALDLLLGGKARHGIVREGAAEAYVEGVFSMPPGLEPELAERLPDGAEEIVLARRVWPDGRTRAYVCGRSATRRRPARAGPAAAGLLRPARAPQADAGRRAAGDPRRSLRRRAAGAAGADGGASTSGPGGSRSACSELRGVGRSPRPGAGPGRLRARGDRGRLAHRARRRSRADARARAPAPSRDPAPRRGRRRAEAIAPEVGHGGRRAGGRRRRSSSSRPPAWIPPSAPLAERLQALRFEAEDLAGELKRLPRRHRGRARVGWRRSRSGWRCSRAWQRKHGGSIAEVLAHAERCRAPARRAGERRRRAGGGRGRAGRRRAELERARRRADRAPARGRRRAGRRGPRPAGRAGDARCRVRGRAAPAGGRLRAARRGLGRVLDRAQRRAAGRSAARGRLGRRALAGDAGAAERRPRRRDAGRGRRARPQPLLVFDEIDAGIGGHTARAVGEHLRELAQRAADPVHHPPAAGGGARRAALHDRQGQRGACRRGRR